MNIKKVVKESDFVTYHYEECKSLSSDLIDHKDNGLPYTTDEESIICMYNFKNKGNWSPLQIDHNLCMTFYKLINGNYIAWCKHENNKWEIINSEVIANEQ